MKKVLFLTHHQLVVEQFLKPVVALYREYGYQVDFASTYQKESLEDSEFEIGVKQSPFKFISNSRAFYKLVKLVKENQYEVINCHNPVTGIMGRLLKIFFPHIQVIYTAHGFHFFKGSSKVNWLIYYPIEKLFSRLTDQIITINQEDYELAKSKFHAKKVSYVHGVGVDGDVHPIISKKLKPLTFISIARLDKNKNHMTFIQSLPALKEKYPDLKYYVLGEGRLLDDLKLLVDNLGLNSNVEFVGYTRNLEKYLSNSDIFVSLSKREGLPKSIMESMTYNLPSLLTDIRGHRDLVNHQMEGFLLVDTDIESIHKGVYDIIDNYHFYVENTHKKARGVLWKTLESKYREILFEDIKE